MSHYYAVIWSEDYAAALDLLQDLLGGGRPDERLGVVVVAARYASMAAMSSGTERNTPRRMALSVSSRNQRSTRLSHELRWA